ncbi:ZDHHC2 [Symbiodinium natans]|uniref:ZDHHC2 protein n=1 Tax=Symbiodinium natans TaxID=878477 RepID=A0A812RT00_9DINO|nr:ZDHHC2 [Symbiodinium natans]
MLGTLFSPWEASVSGICSFNAWPSPQNHNRSDDTLPRSPVDWAALRHRVAGCPVFIDALAAKDSKDSARRAFQRTISMDRVWQQAEAASNIDIRFSSHQHDCYLGTLAYVFCQHLNGMAAAIEDGVTGSEEWMQHYLKLNLELEAIMFHMELPWSLLIRSRFRFGPLLTRLSRFVKEAGRGEPSRCDENDWPEDTELLKHADESGLLPVNTAETLGQRALLKMNSDALEATAERSYLAGEVRSGR